LLLISLFTNGNAAGRNGTVGHVALEKLGILMHGMVSIGTVIQNASLANITIFVHQK